MPDTAYTPAAGRIRDRQGIRVDITDPEVISRASILIRALYSNGHEELVYDGASDSFGPLFSSSYETAVEPVEGTAFRFEVIRDFRWPSGFTLQVDSASEAPTLPAWDPTLEASLRLWLRPEGLTGSEYIPAWEDASGAENDVTQAAPENSPTFGEVGGYDAADFSGVGYWLRSSALLGDIITASAFTALVVVDFDSLSAGSSTVYLNQSVIRDTNAYWGIHVRDDSGTLRAYGYIWDGAARSASVELSGLGPHLLEFRYDGVSIHMRADNGGEETALSGSVQVVTANLNVGAHGGGTPGMDGRIPELVIYNAYLADASEGLEAARAHLGAKYGVSV